jgi:hypothetical protein
MGCAMCSPEVGNEELTAHALDFHWTWCRMKIIRHEFTKKFRRFQNQSKATRHIANFLAFDWSSKSLIKKALVLYTKLPRSGQVSNSKVSTGIAMFQWPTGRP